MLELHERHEPPARAGIGLRHAHYAEFDARRPDVGFVEVHSENFFNRYDAASAVLRQVRDAHAVSLHGVGLSLGAAAGVDADHLDALAELVERIEPCRVSDHASFARGVLRDARAVHANDLLPLAFTDAQLAILADNVQRVQDRLHRPLLVENLSSYLGWRDADLSEPAFFAELGRRSGCGLLLDVNNLMVNAKNAKAADPLRSVCDWIDELAELAAPGLVGEIHLAGHSEQRDLVVDDHASVVSLPVWMAYAHALRRFGGVPTLIEWDTDLPELDVLLGEAAQAQALLGERAAIGVASDGAVACAA
ncbi:hypothetical protein GALL_382290 [mine drainage metagenome]|uniref:DUF692 domain-containing protein n=1 Tax=mine drainage metagenome TaxID=410659 RepID=A0A1J5QVV8_9ZZZZ